MSVRRNKRRCSALQAGSVGRVQKMRICFAEWQRCCCKCCRPCSRFTCALPILRLLLIAFTPRGRAMTLQRAEPCVAFPCEMELMRGAAAVCCVLLRLRMRVLLLWLFFECVDLILHAFLSPRLLWIEESFVEDSMS